MEKEGIETLQISKFYPLRDGEINRDLMPSAEEFENSLGLLLGYSKSAKMKVVFDNSFSFLITGKVPKDASRRCSGGISKLIIDNNGNCYPCQLLPLKEFYMGNILNEDLEKIWNSPSKKKFIEEFFPEIVKLVCTTNIVVADAKQFHIASAKRLNIKILTVLDGKNSKKRSSSRTCWLRIRKRRCTGKA
jgi:MoaA/NifB/PqqE/SkfB family radical SAM enzyme